MKKSNILTASAAMLLVAGLFVSGCKKDDTTAPVVTLGGSSNMSISLNTAFVDPGATASDDEDGTISVSVSGTVDKDTKGTYTLTYSATDAAGNTGTATRVVTVANDAESWVGTYAVHDSCGPTTIYNYNQTVTSDDHVNNRIHFDKFADYSNNGSIYATISGGGNNIDVPSQTATGIGSLSESHTFSGTGIRSGSNFGLTYTDINNSASGASTTCIAVWTKM